MKKILFILLFPLLVLGLWLVSDVRNKDINNDIVLKIKTNKVLYKPKENVRIDIFLSNNVNKSSKIKYELYIEKDFNSKILNSGSINLNGNEQKNITFSYTPQKEYGYRLRIKVYKDNELYDEASTVFNVLSDWTKVVIMTVGTAHYQLFYPVSPTTSDQELQNLIDTFADLGINSVQLFDIVPHYGVLHSDKETWLHPRSKNWIERKLNDRDIVISKNRIKKIISLLKDKGMKVIFYDEMGANDNNTGFIYRDNEIFKKEFAIYQPLVIPDMLKGKNYSLPEFFDLDKRFNRVGEPIRIYGRQYPPDGNPYTMKDYYAEQVAKVTKEYSLDGMFYDSLGWLFEAASFGKLYDGSSLGLTPDEIGCIFMKAIDQKVKNITPEFVHIINGGIYKPNLDTIFKNTKLFFKLWTVEFPQGDYVKKIKLYPKTYQELYNLLDNKDYNLFVYQAFFDIKKMNNHKTFLAMTFSSGKGIYYHRDDLFKIKEFKDTIKAYNIFAIEYGNFLFGDRLKRIDIDVEGLPKNILTKTYTDGNYIVLHLINAEPDTNIWYDNKREIFKNIRFKIKLDMPLKEAFIRTPDNFPDYIGNLYIEKINDLEYKFTIDELNLWSMVVIKLKKK